MNLLSACPVLFYDRRMINPEFFVKEKVYSFYSPGQRKDNLLCVVESLNKITALFCYPCFFVVLMFYCNHFRFRMMLSFSKVL